MFAKVIDMWKEYGTILKLWLGPKLVVFISDPRDIEIILSSHVHIDKAAEYSFFKPWLGDGLLISTGKFSKIFFQKKNLIN